MTKLKDALADPSAAVALDLDVDADVLDDRLAALTGLERVTFRNAHRDFTLPPAVVAAWTKLTSVTFEPKRTAQLVMPEVTRALPIQTLRVERATRALALPAGLKELIIYSFADDVAAVVAAAAAQAKHLERLALYADEEHKARRRAAEDADDATVVRQPLPPTLPPLALPALKQLDVNFTVDDLSVLRGCPALHELEFVAGDAGAAITSLAASGVPLAVLKLRGKDGMVLPDALARLPLTRLDLHAAAELPASLATMPLKELHLHAVTKRAVPEGVGQLSALEVLVVGARINTLPASLAQCGALRVLRLTGALNDGVMVSRWDDTKKLKPLPAALSSLTSLEELNLDHCGVVDVAPLATLTKLKKLSIEWSAITDVGPLAALTNIEELSLHYADRVRDFAPLAALQQLRVLNLSNTRPKNLDVLRALPALRELNIEGIGCKRLDAVFARELEKLEADDEVQAAYAKRAALRALPPTEQLVKDLESDDAAVVDAALAHLAQWGAANSTRDENALIALLRGEPLTPTADDDEDDDDEDDDEDDDDEDDDYDDDEGNEDEDEHNDEDEDNDEGDDHEGDEGDGEDDAEDGDARPAAKRLPKGRLPGLDEALARHKDALSTRTLAALFGALFRGVEDDVPAALVAAAEVVARGSDADQLACMSAVDAAFEYYDPGHRMWEATVHDKLCDEVLGQFRAPALAAFLAKASDPLLFEDGLSGLFAPAMRGADDDVRAVLTPRLKRFAAYLVRYGARDGRTGPFWLTFSGLPAASAAAVLEIRTELEAEELAHNATEALRQRLHKSRRDGGLAQVLVDLEAAGPVAIDALRPYLSQYVTPALDDDSVLRVLRLAPNDLNEVVAGLAAAPERVPTIFRQANVDAAAAREAVLGALVFARRQLQERLGREEGESWGTTDEEAEQEEAERSQKREALRAERAATVAGLRSLYASVAGVDADAAVRADVEAVIAAARDYDRTDLAAVIDAVLDAPGLTLQLPKRAQTQLASTLGQTADDETQWPRFLAWAKQLHRMGLLGEPLERVLAQLLAIAIRDEDDAAVDAVVALVPAQVTWGILAYNLACLFARRGARTETLAYTKRSIELGKTPQQFENDDDFADWVDDDEFKALLASVS